MNPDEIQQLYTNARKLAGKFPPEQVAAYIAEQSNGLYTSLQDVQRAQPAMMLRDASRLAQKGFAAADIDKWVQDRSGGSVASVQALAEHVAAVRNAQRIRDNQPTTALGKAAAYVGGAVNRAMDTATFGAMPMIRGVQQALDPVNTGGKSMAERYRAGRNQAQEEAASFEQQNPTTAKVAEVVGAPLGLVPFLLGGEATPFVRGAAVPVNDAVAQAARWASENGPNAVRQVFKPWLQNTAKNVAAGTAIGQVSGLLNAPNANPGASLYTNINDAIPSITLGGTQNGLLAGALSTAIPVLHSTARTGRNFAAQLARDPATIEMEANRRIGTQLNEVHPTSPSAALAGVDEAAAMGLPDVRLVDAAPNLTRLGVAAKNKVPLLSNLVNALKMGREAARAPDLVAGMGRATGTQEQALAKGLRTAQEHVNAEVGSAADVRRVVGKQYDAVDPIEIPSNSPVAQTVKRMANLGREVSPMEAMVRNQNAKMGVGEPVVPPEHGDPAIAQTVNSVLKSRGNQPMTVKLVRTLIRKLNDGAANAFAPGSRNTDLGNAYRNAAEELQTALADPVNGVPEVAKLNAEYTKAKAVEQAYIEGAKAVDSPNPDAAMAELNRLREVGGQEAVDAHRYGGQQKIAQDAMAAGENKAGMALSRMRSIANPVRAQNGGAGRAVLDNQRALYEHFMGGPENATAMDRRILGHETQRQTELWSGAGSRTGTETGDATNTFEDVLSAASRGGGKWSQHAYFNTLLQSLRNPAERAIMDNVGRKLFGREYNAAMRPQVVEWMRQYGYTLDAMRAINQSVELGGILAAPHHKKFEYQGLLGRAVNSLGTAP